MAEEVNDGGGAVAQNLRSILSSPARDFLVRNDGEKVPISELEGKTIGLLFSVASHRLRTEFTSQLVEVYNNLKESNKDFEIVLVSLEDDEESFKKDFETQPWLALPFNDKSNLSRHFLLSSIPTLVILGPDGKTRHSNAVEAINRYGVLSYPFTPEKLEELNAIENAKLEGQTLDSLLVSGDPNDLLAKKRITKTQQTFDRALSTLPVTQHGIIWESYLIFVSQEGVPVETSLSVYRRYEDHIQLLVKSGRGLEAAENLLNVLSRVQILTGEVGILWTSTVEHLICVLGEWARMELRHMNFRSDTAGPSVEFRQRATNTDMEDSVPVRIGMGGKARRGRRKMKSVSTKSASISNKKYTPDDQEWPRDLPEHFVDICKDWRNTPFIIRPAAYQGLLDLCWAVCISRSVESAFNLLDDGREPVRLSSQHLVNGVHKHKSGYITHFNGVRDFMQKHGMVPEDQCPWTGKVDKDLGCTHEHVEEESVYRVNDLVYLDKIVEKDLILILQNQPILAVMKYCDELEDLREGIYDGPSTSENTSAKKRWRSGLHVVEVLGYNTDTAGKHYWLVQMASGARWGVNGVGKVMRQISRKEDKSLFVGALYPKVGLREA